MTRDDLIDARPRAPLAFFAKTLVCQVIAAGMAVMTWGLAPSVWLTLVSSTLVATGLALFLELSFPWIVLNAALPLGAASALAVTIPHEIFFVVFLLLLCTYVPAFWTRVPYYPTQRAAYPIILAQLPIDQPFSFIDIGCGFGDLLVLLARKRPNGTFVGIEIGPLPFAIAKARSLTTPNLSVRFESMWRCDLSCYDFVYAFLSPAPMERLWQKASHEMRPSAMFMSNSFPAPTEPTETIALKDARQSQLFVYLIRPACGEALVG